MSAIIIPNVEECRLDVDQFTCFIPIGYRDPVKVRLEYSKEKHNGFMKLGLDTPFKPRTPRAQGKLHALIADLAPILTMSLAECKMFVKNEAVAIGYGTEQKILAKGTPRERAIRRPKSEADASTLEEHMLIETCYKLAADEGYDLEAMYRNKMRGM